MKITQIEMFEVKVALAKPYRLSKVVGTKEWTHAIILKMHTDKEIVGLGEANPTLKIGGESPSTVKATLQHDMAPILLGEDPLALNRLEQALNNVIRANWAAKAAVSMALYDIAGKFYGLPVCRLLGGSVVSELPVLWPLSSGSAKEDLETIEDKHKEGYRTFMIKMGALPITDEIERIVSLRRHFSDDICLIVDANQGWTRFEAERFVHGLGDYQIDLLEQPLPRWDDFGYAQLRNIVPWPISMDEGVITIGDATKLINRQVADVFSIKIAKHGGIGKSRAIASLAEAHGLKCMMNSEIEFGITQSASLHLGCTLHNLVEWGHAYMSPLRLGCDVTDYSRLVAHGKVRVPERPGLGVRLAEAVLQEHTKNHIQIG
jgi:muconate cycloisomerase